MARMTTFTVTVLHNVSRDMFFRYHPDTSSLHHAHTFELDEPDDTSPESVANLAWHLANVAGPDDLPPRLEKYAEQVTAYRSRRNRSLSVSDVLVIHVVDAGDTEGNGWWCKAHHDGLCYIAGVLVVASVGHEGLEFVPTFEAGSNDTEVSKAYEASQRFYQAQGA